jgi:hypothetical protein
MSFNATLAGRRAAFYFYRGVSMLTMIGIFVKDGKHIAKPVYIKDYNKAVPKLNEMLMSGKAREFLLPEEKPDIAKRLGLL